jgi:hypothetical protein
MRKQEELRMLEEQQKMEMQRRLEQRRQIEDRGQPPMGMGQRSQPQELFPKVLFLCVYVMYFILYHVYGGIAGTGTSQLGT